jgi:hypothetical protein
MFKFVRICSLYAALGCIFALGSAHAQVDAPAEHKQFNRMDLAFSVPYEVTRSSSGRSSIGPVSQSVSTTAGFLATFRYTYSPLIGLEMNYKRSRMTQNYIYSANQTNPTPPPSSIVVPMALGVQASVIETSWGYVAHTRSSYYSFTPFGGVGLGSLEFKPTPAGGEGLIRQFRAVYYWNIGADYNIMHSHFGARAEMRQLFYLAPDFGQNYLTSGARTSTLEPSIGFYARF